MAYELYLKYQFNRISGVTETFWVGTTRERHSQLLAKQLSSDDEKLAWLFKNGARIDRPDGPAYTAINPDGTIKEVWAEKGKTHRLDGPAVTLKGKNGDVMEERWYYQSERVTMNNLTNLLDSMPGISWSGNKPGF